MFFKMSVLKKMIKEAYKAKDLILGHYELVNKEDGTYEAEGWVIIGGWWSIYIDRWFAPKELKAALIEVAGELPYNGHYFRVLSEGNQEMVEAGPCVNPIYLFAKCQSDVNVSKLEAVFQTNPVRLLQNHETNKVTGIRELGCQLIDRTAVDYDNGEYEPIGPRTATDDIMCWGNNVCYLAIWPYKLLDEDKEHDKEMFLKALSEIELPI